MPPQKLTPYRGKRDFQATPEPAGDGDGEAAGGRPAGDGDGSGAGRRQRRSRAGNRREAAPRFVVQEHHATRLHWDLRLERDGVLASWAIPNGIPPDRKENRLAVHTEDHPLEYLNFHGEIPKGQYGAGTMTIWDRGTYELHKWEQRKVEVTFAGERLQGRYGLFSIARDDASQHDWMIHRMDPPSDPAREPFPERIVPMLARAADGLPTPDRDWAYEIKWDGIRAIAYIQPGRIRLESRNLNEVTDAYPEVRGLLGQLGMRDAVLDGEIVAFGDGGRPSFERLQKRMHVTSPAAVRRLTASIPVVYAIFDLLYLDGHSLMGLPYRERRARLEQLGLGGPAWRVPAAHNGDGERLLAATAGQGLEGIVAKKLECPYEPGRRTGTWLKIKHTSRQDLVIGGWLPGEGRRERRIGALLMGYYDGGGDLRYAGRVGTGFTDQVLDDLASRLAPLRRDGNPFVGAPKLPRNAQFVDPCLVAEIEFREWTEEAIMRAPSYKGLREDKAPREVVLERAAKSSTDERADERTNDPGEPDDVNDTDDTGDVESLFDEVQRLPEGVLAIRTGGRTLKLSNWDKVLFPEIGFTKGDLIAYYARVAPAVLPHLHDRALTLKRYPNGIESPYFYEKQAPSHRPEWVATQQVGDVLYILAQDRPTLVWLANLADIELHTSLSLAGAPQRPTMLVFDLDPGAPADIVHCCEVALVLRGLFAALGLETYPKTSGSKGMQVYLPLNTAITYTESKPFARRVAELLEQRLPKLVVSRMTKRLRPGRVLVDWSQNDAHKTTVTVYSVRARDRPTVSTPVTWQEVTRCHEERDPELLSFDTDQVLARVAAHGDLFAPLLTLTQTLPPLQ